MPKRLVVFFHSYLANLHKIRPSAVTSALIRSIAIEYSPKFTRPINIKDI